MRWVVLPLLASHAVAAPTQEQPAILQPHLPYAGDGERHRLAVGAVADQQHLPQHHSVSTKANPLLPHSAWVDPTAAANATDSLSQSFNATGKPSNITDKFLNTTINKDSSSAWLRVGADSGRSPARCSYCPWPDAVRPPPLCSPSPRPLPPKNLRSSLWTPLLTPCAVLFAHPAMRAVYIGCAVVLPLLLMFAVWNYDFLRFDLPRSPAVDPVTPSPPAVLPPSYPFVAWFLKNAWPYCSMALAVALTTLGVLTIPIAYATGMLSHPWYYSNYMCYVAYDGVVCNNTFISTENDYYWVSQQTPSAAGREIYMGLTLFVSILLMSLAIHWWRACYPSRAERLHHEAKTARPTDPPRPLAELDVGRQLLDGLFFYIRRHAQLVSVWWLDWLQPIFVGCVVGFCMICFQVTLQCVMCGIWGGPVTTGARETQDRSTHPLAVLLIPPIMLGAAGTMQSYMSGGAAGNFVQAVNSNLHIDPFRGLIATTLISIVAIASGGSAGPEGPVLYIGASIAVLARLPRWLLENAFDSADARMDPSSRTWDWRRWWRPYGGHERLIGDDVLIGGAAAIAAFFDHPISGCLFVMELPHMHGSVARGDTLPAALVASIFAWRVHRSFMDSWNVMSPPVFPVACAEPGDLWRAMPMGLISAFISYSFIKIRYLLDALPYPKLVRGLTMGAIVGLVGLYLPDTLTWGEFQLDIIANNREPLNVYHSTKLGVAKFFAVVITVACGYGAGIVYPLMMIGYLFGPLAAYLLPKTEMITNYIQLSESYAWCETLDPTAVTPRPIGVELDSQALASGVLAATMRAPVGTAILVSFMGRSGDERSIEPAFLCLLLLTNLIAVYVNPLSGLGQVYGKDSQGKDTLRAAPTGKLSRTPAQLAAEEAKKGSSDDEPMAPFSADSVSFVSPIHASLANWVLFGLCFGLNYGTFKTALGYMGSFFLEDDANLANTAAYGSWLAVALLLAAAIVEVTKHPKWLFIVSFLLYAVEMAFLCVANGVSSTALPIPTGGMTAEASTGGTAVRALLVCGSICGGAASAISWTAQGVYFAAAAKKHACLCTGPASSPTSIYMWFAAFFAFAELLSEAAVRGITGFVFTYLFDSHIFVLILMAVACLLGAVGCLGIQDLTNADAQGKSAADADADAPAFESFEDGKGAAAAASKADSSPAASSSQALLKGSMLVIGSIRLLVTSPVALLLQPFALLKGFNEVAVADYVNTMITEPHYGTGMIGYLTGAGILLGSVLALFGGPITAKYGRGVMMLLGIVSYTLPSVMDIVRHAVYDHGGGLYVPVIYYLCYGIGRAAFDSTLRLLAAVCLPDNLEQIFALLRFTEAIAGVVGFSVCPCKIGWPVSQIILVVGALALVGYWVVEHLDGYGQKSVRRLEGEGRR